MIRGKKREKNKYKNGGYTLIEIVIVLMITSMVFVSIYALFAKSMKYDTEGRYEIVASELAQEGIEMVKNKKEKNEMDWAVWKGPDSGVIDVDDDINGLRTFKGINSEMETPCNPDLTWEDNGADYKFNCDDANTEIKYNKGIKKYVKISDCAGNCVGMKLDRKCSTLEFGLDGSNALRVTCVVSWNSPLLNGGERKVKATLVLTDWER